MITMAPAGDLHEMDFVPVHRTLCKIQFIVIQKNTTMYKYIQSTRLCQIIAAIEWISRWPGRKLEAAIV